MKRVVWVLILAMPYFLQNAFALQGKKNDADRIIDSILKTRQPDTAKALALIDHGYEHAINGKKAALTYNNAALKLLGNQQALKYIMLKTQANNCNGIYYMFTGNYTMAEKYYRTSMALGKAINQPYIIARAYGNLGGMYNNKGDYKQALSNILLALKYFDNSSDKINRLYVMGDLANTYIRLKQYTKAVNALNEAIAYTQKTGDKRFEANLYNSLAIAYDEMNSMQKSLQAHIRSYTLYKQINNDKGIGTAALNLGNTYTELKKFDLADKYLKESIVHATRINDIQNQAEAYAMLADNESASGRLLTASQYADSAIKYNKQAQNRHLMASIYLKKSSIMYKLGNYKQGYDWIDKFRVLNDSVLNTNINEQVAEMEAKYETEKKQRENQKLSLDNKIKTLQRNKAVSDRNTVLFSAGLGILLLIVVFVSVYRNKHIKDKYEQEQVMTKALFEGEQKERIRIARDLHDSIGQLLSVVKMNVSNLNDRYQDSQIGNTEALVDKTITEVRHISHNLIPEELNFGLFAALEDMCEKINAAGNTEVTLQIPDEAREHQFEESNELSIYRIVQEVLSNMVKHSQASQIQLNVTGQGNGFNLSIKDNGRGFDTAQINKSKGLGWKNIAARVNMLDGKMQVRSEQLTGTQIEITIPEA